MLPAAVFGFFVVYCLRSVDFTMGSHGIPEAVAVAATAKGALVIIPEKVIITTPGADNNQEI